MPPRGSATQRTALFARQQPGGFWNTADIMSQPGNIWFVDSGAALAADAAGMGRNPDRPFATLDFAVGQCTANNGDIIYVMPGHAENLGADSAVDVDVQGVKIVGLGWGDSRPTFTCTAVAGDFKLAATCCWIENLVFVNAVDNSTGLLEVSAATNTIVNCTFYETILMYADVMLLTTAAADYLHIYGCQFYGNVADGAVSLIEIVGGSHIHIHDCYFYGNCDTGVIQVITTATVDLRIHDCIINQLDDTAGAGNVQMILDTITGSTGILGPNLQLVGIIDAANVTEAITGATFKLVDPVYVVNAVAEKALLINWAVTADA